ncbi:hypothetical protein BD414DRAFT_535739 [Trametes punicea]|nr:hypothetical protein BD414DRAFT_535739 [Trametes punicea]
MGRRHCTPPPLGLKDLVSASFALLIPSFTSCLCALPLPSLPSASAKGKKATTLAQLRATVLEELSALFASTLGGSITGEEEYTNFAHCVLAQLDVIGDGDFMEEVAYQAVRLVHETIGFTSGVEREEVIADIPWTHPLYRQAFVQVQAELAAECEDEPMLAGEVEAEVAEVSELAGDDMEVVEEVPPVPQTHVKCKVAPVPFACPSTTPPRTSRARTKLLVFLEPMWRLAFTEPSPSICCSYCTSHPKGGCCVPRGGKKPFGDWYDGEGHTRTIHLDGVVAAKVIRLRGQSSNLPGLPPLSPLEALPLCEPPKDTPSASAGSAKLSHIKISVPRVCFAVPTGPSSSSQPTASSSMRAMTLPSLPSLAPVTPPNTHLPLLLPCVPLAPPSFCTPADASTSAMPPPSTLQQLVLRELVKRETRWFCETFAHHLLTNLLLPQDSAPLDLRCTPAGDAYVRALESICDALSGQVAALASVRDEMRICTCNAPLSDAEIFSHYTNW